MHFQDSLTERERSSLLTLGGVNSQRVDGGYEDIISYGIITLMSKNS